MLSLLFTEPEPVTGLKAINKTFTTITITWQPLNVVNITYQVNYTNKVLNRTMTPVVITGLQPRKNYTISVTGYITAGPGTPQQLQTSTADIRTYLE